MCPLQKRWKIIFITFYNKCIYRCYQKIRRCLSVAAVLSFNLVEKYTSMIVLISMENITWICQILRLLSFMPQTSSWKIKTTVLWIQIKIVTATGCMLPDVNPPPCINTMTGIGWSGVMFEENTLRKRQSSDVVTFGRTAVGMYLTFSLISGWVSINCMACAPAPEEM